MEKNWGISLLHAWITLAVFLASTAVSAEEAWPRFEHKSHGVFAPGGEMPLCSDGVDNDGDGKVDAASRGCKKKVGDCASCHREGRKIAHRECKACHPMGRMVRNGKAARMCSACHTGYKKKRGRMKMTFAFPPYQKREGAEFILTRFNHGRHATIGMRDCTVCHSPAWRAKKKKKAGRIEPVTHAACATCHARGIDPAMNRCQGCHSATSAPSPALWSRRASPFRVTNAFDHRSHEAKSGNTDCVNCHTDVNPGVGEPVLRPKKVDCSGCHDGKTSFSTEDEAHCKSCHKSGDKR